MDIKLATNEVLALIAKEQRLIELTARCEMDLKRDRQNQAIDWEGHYEKQVQVERARGRIKELRGEIRERLLAAHREAWKLWERSGDLKDDTAEEKAANDPICQALLDQAMKLHNILPFAFSSEEIERIWGEILKPAFHRTEAEIAEATVYEASLVASNGAQLVGDLR